MYDFVQGVAERWICRLNSQFFGGEDPQTPPPPLKMALRPHHSAEAASGPVDFSCALDGSRESVKCQVNSAEQRELQCGEQTLSYKSIGTQNKKGKINRRKTIKYTGKRAHRHITLANSRSTVVLCIFGLATSAPPFQCDTFLRMISQRNSARKMKAW